MAYVKTNWENEPSKQTPISAENLNHMEDGIYNAQEAADTAQAGVDSLNTRSFAPIPVELVADMTDETKNYLYLGSETGYESGYLYYWDGTAWTKGNEYQTGQVVTDPTLEQQGKAADAKAVGDALGDLNNALTSLDDVIKPALEYNARIQPSNAKWLIEQPDECIIKKISAGDSIYIKANSTNTAQYAFLASFTKPVDGVVADIAGYSGSGNYVLSINAGDDATVTAPNGTNYLYILHIRNNGADHTPISVTINGDDINDTAIESNTKNIAKKADSTRVDNSDRVLFATFDDVGALAELNGRIRPQVGDWIIEVSDKCKVMKINAGDHVYVKANGSQTAQFAYLSTFSFPVNGASANIAGYDGGDYYVRITNGVNGELDEYAPVGTKYLYILCVDNNGNDKTPGVCRINGVTYNFSVEEVCRNTHKVLSAMQKPWHFESKNLSFTSGETKKFDFKQCIRKNLCLSFSGTIASFTSMSIGLIGMGEYGVDLEGYDAKVTVNGTNVILSMKNYEGTYDDTTVAHGLTISNELQIMITGDDTNKATIKIASLGQEFSTEQSWEAKHYYYPFVTADNCTISNGVLTITSEDIRKDIWVFGDSYIRYVNTRWPYWLHETGYDKNVLINGHGGAHSIDESIDGLKSLLQCYVPKYVLWCLGMNDTPDTSTVIGANWATGRDRLLDLAEQYGFTPVFTTIPNVPDRNHDLKNAWIRSSGYQYIDFCEAVGANSEGVWYYGLRENERTSGDIGRHPSELGAKVLCNQVLISFPQIKCSK